MGKKIILSAFAVLIFVLCLVPGLGTAIAGPSRAGANERLSAAPALTAADGKPNLRLFSEASDWFGDHFFLRQELISANNRFSAALFGVSAEEDVILGSEGWLYYAPTLEDFTGTAGLSERELWCAANNLKLMQDYCTAHEIDFLFASAPNKNTVYPEHMPDYGTVSAEHDISRLHALLDGMGVRYADLYGAFAAESETLYYAHDSHWNDKGAALAADRINALLGAESSFYAADFSGEAQHQGDLFEMLYPAFTDRETGPVCGSEPDFAYEGNATKADSITLLTSSAAPGSLLAFRDSFGNSLHPYLAASFGYAKFSRAVSYDLAQTEELGTTAVLIELVERNLDYLVKNVPFFAAPECADALPVHAVGTASGSIDPTAKAPEGTVLFRGTLPAEPDTASPVLLDCGGTAYECFCLENGGFAAYIPAESVPMRVVCSVGGDLTAFSFS